MSNNETSNHAGMRLRAVRNHFNLKQQEFAAKLNMSGTSLSEIETGKYKPGIELLVSLYRKFNVNIFYLLLGEGDMFMDPIAASYLEAGDYAVNVQDVREFLQDFKKSPLLQYFILSQYKGKMLADKELILKEIEEIAARKRDQSPK